MKTYTCFSCSKTFSPKFKPANLDKPYCSSSCSAKENNKVPKRKKNPLSKTCRRCSKPLSRNSSFYCSNDCFNIFRTAANIANWLDTGRTSPLGSLSYVKKYLLKDQNYCCAICSIPSEWQGKPLLLICDHIDGDSNNNNRTNLRMVCSNCDSQLSTYKIKNKNSGRHYRRERYREGKSY